MFVKVFNASSCNPLPEYKTPESAGVDLRAHIEETLIIHPGERKLIPTGIHVEMEAGLVAYVCSRSGLAHKNGVIVLNAPGVVDSDYRGDIGVPLTNLGSEDFVVQNGDRIAQLVFQRVEHAEFMPVGDISYLSDTERGDGGFGHTGVK